jgi:type I restriction enzyme M protein
MSHTDFKNRVDGLMNILWSGGVANHSTIIEQINYLVFLRSLSKKDDHAMRIDSEAERVFQGELAQYHWDNLLVLNAEVLFSTLEDIYRRLPELTTDKTIQLLYRDAHVKVFDKPTLRRLVHEIEQLMRELEEEATTGRNDIFGDMYEYLLSKLAQAGTLGSFRTPRHIIKFIVDVIDPNKGETILDPACGTAGFLVAALEHLKDKYSSQEFKKEGKHPLDLLSPEERKFLFQHTFTGFDSDFDMFKFGLMNLYLHQLEHPNIKRINTLVDTAGDRTKWDIILANPPFAGAVDRSSISEDLQMGTRATELLFLRYMIDHLSPTGRTGVIVPEGVLFSGSNAHKKIRQLLIEEAGLWAVVSLPGGVFNPYAGVKTSILFFDKTFINKAHHILFVKVDNDGFDLGAQRRPTPDKNDLHNALNTILKYQSGVINGVTNPIEAIDILGSEIANLVPKQKVIESVDYNLSGERYKENTNPLNQNWPMVELGEVLSYEQPTKYLVSSVNYDDKYQTPVLTAGKTFILGYTDETTGVYQDRLPVIIFDDFTTATKFVDFPFKVKSSAMKILHTDKNRANIKFLFYMMQKIVFPINEHKRYWISQYSKIMIPLPTLEVQNEIVNQIEAKQQVIEHAKIIIEKLERERQYFGRSLRGLENIDWVELENVSTIVRGSSPRPKGDKRYYFGNIPRLMVADVTRDGMYTTPKIDFLTDEGAKLSRPMKKGDLIMAVSGNPGLCTILATDACIHDGFVGFRGLDRSKILAEFAYYYLMTMKEDNHSSSVGAIFRNLNTDQIKKIKIPIPSLETQRDLIQEMEKDEEAIRGNKTLISRYESKIADVLNAI